MASGTEPRFARSRRMVWHHLRGFVSRRLSTEEYLGLHLTVGLLLSLCLLGLFVEIARAVEENRTQFDEHFGQACAQHRQESPVSRGFFLVITQFGSFNMMTTLAIFGALLLLVYRRRLLALVWVLAPAIGGLLDAALKQFYNRPRPLFRDPAVFEDTLSFPSGHSLASLIAFGLLAYVLVLILPRVWMRVAVVVLLGLLVLSIGFSRAYLGAHYLTDVLGGFAVGGCWLAVCISGLETIRRRRKWLAEEKVSQPELARQEG